jgi:hypothetical protein
MTDTIESLRARIAELERERDALRSANPAEGLISVIMERERAARADAARLAEALRRAIKYAREDRARTPGSTRLARLFDGEAKRALAAHDAGTPADDPRDAEIARLRAALAAGPAALRALVPHSTSLTWEDAVEVVEAAQKKAMGDS